MTERKKCPYCKETGTIVEFSQEELAGGISLGVTSQDRRVHIVSNKKDNPDKIVIAFHK